MYIYNIYKASTTGSRLMSQYIYTSYGSAVNKNGCTESQGEKKLRASSRVYVNYKRCYR
jgi:hypothetical protein